MYSFFKQCHIILITTDSHWNYGVILLQDYVEYAILPSHINWRISFSLFTKEIVGLYIKLRGQSKWCPIKGTDIGIFKTHRKQDVETSVWYPRALMMRWEETKEASEACRPRDQAYTSAHKASYLKKCTSWGTKLKLSIYLHEHAVNNLSTFTLKNLYIPTYHIPHITIFLFKKKAGILPKIFNLQKTLGRTDICTILNQMTKKNLPIYLSLIWFFCIRVLLFKYYWSCMWLVRFKHVSLFLQVNVEGMASLNSNLSCSVLESRKCWLFHSNFSVFKIMNILSFGEDLLETALKAGLPT